MRASFSTTALAVVFGLAATAALAAVSLRTVERMIDGIRSEAVEARDAHWRAVIEQSNADIASREAAQARAALALETETAARVRAAEDELQNRKNDSAALANADDCGLGRERVRLLPD